MESFHDVVGQQALIQSLQRSIATDQVSHASIFYGEKGSGKKLLARIFAKTLLCEQGGTDPCNVCHSCRQAESGNHPDLIQISHEKPGTISVEEIRTQVTKTAAIKPYEGPYKIYLIPEADLMTTQAQNALLKTLEEPPSYVVLLLLTDNLDALLPTIRSRCVLLQVRKIPDAQIKTYLTERQHLPENQAELCTAFARGNLGKALLLAQSSAFNEMLEDMVELVRKIGQMDAHELSETVSHLTTYKDQMTDYLDLLLIWYRDVLLVKSTGNLAKVVLKGYERDLQKDAENCSYEGIQCVLDALDEARNRIQANVNFELVMELLLLTIQETESNKGEKSS